MVTFPLAGRPTIPMTIFESLAKVSMTCLFYDISEISLVELK